MRGPNFKWDCLHTGRDMKCSNVTNVKGKWRSTHDPCCWGGLLRVHSNPKLPLLAAIQWGDLMGRPQRVQIDWRDWTFSYPDFHLHPGMRGFTEWSNLNIQFFCLEFVEWIESQVGAGGIILGS